MGAYRGNIPKVEADVDTIIERLRKTKVTLGDIQRECHVSYGAFKRVLLSRITTEEYDAIVRKKRRDSVGPTRFCRGDGRRYIPPKGVHLAPDTEFRKGHLPTNHKGVGTMTVRNNKCGKQFRWIKISGLQEGMHKWIPYAQHLWIQANGPVPKGYFVVHEDGETMNDNVSNLGIVDRQGHLALQMRRDPKMLKKCRAMSAKAAHRRRAENQKKKAKDAKWAAKRVIWRQQYEAKEAKERAKRQGVESRAETLKGEKSTWWECNGCGADVFNFPSPPCPKCGHLVYTQINQLSARARATAQAEELASSIG